MKNVNLLTVVSCCSMLVTLSISGFGFSQESSGITSPVTIEVGMFACEDEEGQWIRNEIKDFTATHPNIQVKTLALSQPQRWDQPIEMLPALVENVMAIDSGMGYEIAYLASRGAIVPIDTFLSDEALIEAFPENLFDAVTFNEKIWGVPLSADQMLLVCNMEAFAAAGISTPPRTWEELEDYAKRMTLDHDGDGNIEQIGLFMEFTSHLMSILQTMILQEEGLLFEESKLTLKDPITIKCIRLLDSWMHSDFFLHNDGEFETLSEGIPPSWAMRFVRSDELRPDIVGNKNYQLAPLPTSGKNVIANAGSLYLVVRKSTPEREAASWEFVKWMTRQDVALAEELIHYVCRKDYASPSNSKLFHEVGSKNMEAITKGVALLKDIGPSNIKRRELACEKFIGMSLETAYREKRPLEEVMAEALNEANAMLSPIVETHGTTQNRSFNLYKK